jgi:glycosyltransferase involved in cell wall biosynthesis
VADSGSPLAILVCARENPATRRAGSPVANALQGLGHDITVVEDGPADLSAHDVVLLVGNHGYFPRMQGVLRSIPAAARPLVAVFHSEPLPPPKASGLPRWSSLNKSEIKKILLRDWHATDMYTNAVTLRRWTREGLIDVHFATSAEKEEYVKEQGIPCWHVPYGYLPSLGTILGLERTIDVLFLGDTRPRRRRRLLRYLRRQGIDVDVRGNWFDPSLWGESRSRLLNQTKIVVHLQRYPGKVAALRLILALANGALVVAEPCYRPDPFVPGKHFVMTSIEEMPHTIRHYLSHPDERERIVAEGHRLVTEELTFARSGEAMVSIILEQLRARPPRERVAPA